MYNCWNIPENVIVTIGIYFDITEKNIITIPSPLFNVVSWIEVSSAHNQHWLERLRIRTDIFVQTMHIARVFLHLIVHHRKHMNLPENRVDIVEGQSCTKSFCCTGMEGQTVETL